MIAIFIVRYAGEGVRFRNGLYELASDGKASQFYSEADAIIKAREEGLNLNHVRIVNLAQLNKEARKP